MTISLPDDLHRFVEEQVRSGRFKSADEAVADAVRRVRQRDEKLAVLRAELQKGIDSLARGEGESWDVEEMKAALRKRHTRQAS